MDDKIIAMAREAGWDMDETVDGFSVRLERFTTLVQDDYKNRLAAAIEEMPFGDTASSFATFVRNFK